MRFVRLIFILSFLLGIATIEAVATNGENVRAPNVSDDLHNWCIVCASAFYINPPTSQQQCISIVHNFVTCMSVCHAAHEDQVNTGLRAYIRHYCNGMLDS